MARKQLVKEVPGIYRIRQTVSRFKFSVNTYVMAGSNGLVLDPGFGSRKAANTIERCITKIGGDYHRQEAAFEITRAMATHSHWDHFSGLSRLQKHLGLDILATPLQSQKITSLRGYDHSFWENQAFLNPGQGRTDRSRMKNFVLNAICCPLFRIHFVRGPVTQIREGQSLEINGQAWQVIPVPGHCDDDIALFNADSGVLMSGDLVFRTVPTWLGPENSDLGRYLDSLDRIRNLKGLKLILPAHGSPIKDPVTCISKAMAHSNRRTAQVMGIVAKAGKSGISFLEVYNALYPGKPFLQPFLGGWISVTLKYLLGTGPVVSFYRKNRLVFRSEG